MRCRCKQNCGSSEFKFGFLMGGCWAWVEVCAILALVWFYLSAVVWFYTRQVSKCVKTNRNFWEILTYYSHVFQLNTSEVMHHCCLWHSVTCVLSSYLFRTPRHVLSSDSYPRHTEPSEMTQSPWWFRCSPGDWQWRCTGSRRSRPGRDPPGSSRTRTEAIGLHSCL